MNDKQVLAVGDRVARKVTSRHSSPIKGGSIIARACEEHNTYVVKWDKLPYSSKQEVSEIEASDLILESEAKSTLLQLEKEFDVVAEQLESKLQQAAALISEAGDLANSKGENLSTLYELTGSLMRALDDAGWSTSSMGC